MLEYSGSDVVQEKIYSSKPIKKDLIVEVLSVGNIRPPQVRNLPWKGFELSFAMLPVPY